MLWRSTQLCSVADYYEFPCPLPLQELLGLLPVLQALEYADDVRDVLRTHCAQMQLQG